MRISLKKRLGVAILLIALLLGSTVGVSAAETTDPTESAETTETTEIKETTEATEPAETELEVTEPESLFPETYTVDAESEMYAVLAALEPKLKSDQILVYDATNDTMLYTRSNEGEKLYPASITKLFSCYVALQYLDPEEVLTAGDELELVKPGSSLAYIGRGHRLFVRTVVEAMMLPSGNDAAMVLAAAAGRRIAGDESISASDAVAVFVEEMNRKAEELGFEKSHFANPDGYHLGCHYTCLNDMARIAELALGDKTISRYIRRYQDDVVFASGQTITWKNTNLLLSPEDGFYRGDAIGMKTGHTRQAEYCLMSAFRCRDGRIIVIGSFGCDDEYDRLRDTLKLIKACQEQLNLEAAQKKEAAQ